MTELTAPANEIKNYTDEEILFKIWISPRKILKNIHERNYDKYITVLLVLSGIARTFSRASERNMGDSMSLWGIIAFCVIAGGFFGWITYYIFAALINMTGGWMNGKGNIKSILRIIAYSLIPHIFILILLILQIIIFENELFKSDGDFLNFGIFAGLFFQIFMVLEVALGIYSLIFCTIGISVVQQFSIGKSILNILMPVLIILLPVLFIAAILNII